MSAPRSRAQRALADGALLAGAGYVRYTLEPL